MERRRKEGSDMMDLASNILCGLLGFGTGIFTVLSLIEKPTYRLMFNYGSAKVTDQEARTVHAILKRVIHMLPPTMITAMTGVSVLVALQAYQTGWEREPVIVAVVFFVQLAVVLSVLFPAIKGVDSVPSDGDIVMVRSGLGTLARVHHQGLCMTAFTLAAQWWMLAQ